MTLSGLIEAHLEWETTTDLQILCRQRKHLKQVL